jgi:uncharacterized protein YraI
MNRRRPMNRPIGLRTFAIALFLAAAAPLLAQHAVAKSGVNVRSGQSTNSTIVDHLVAGDTVSLVSPKPRSGYLHVSTSSGKTGWAWAVRLDVLGDSAPSAAATTGRSGGRSTGTSTGTGSSTGTHTAVSTIDASWPKVPTNAAPHTWPDTPHTVCAAVGVGGDTITNRWKNRTDSAATYHEVSWSAIATLDFPRNRKIHRTDPWPAADLAALARYEGIPVSVVGFLSGIKVEVPGKTGGVVGKGESTNCGENTAARVDWHMYLTKGPHQSHAFSVVVETTPRVRPNHSGWSDTKVAALVTAGDTVRVSGWLMFDPEHWSQMWQYKSPADTTGTKARITLWEIHPVTRLEVRRNGAWVSLDGRQ